MTKRLGSSTNAIGERDENFVQRINNVIETLRKVTMSCDQKRFQSIRQGSMGYAIVDTLLNIPLGTALHKVNADFGASIANQVAALFVKNVPLFYGKNDQHEFWQSEGDGYIILRNYPESNWSAHRFEKNGGIGFLFFVGSLGEAVERLGCVIADTSKVWRDMGDGTMILDIPNWLERERQFAAEKHFAESVLEGLKDSDSSWNQDGDSWTKKVFWESPVEGPSVIGCYGLKFKPDSIEIIDSWTY